MPAVVLRFIIIGEAIKQIPVSVTARHPEVEWRNVAGLREIVRTELGPLEVAVEAMIREEGGGRIGCFVYSVEHRPDQIRI